MNTTLEATHAMTAAELLQLPRGRWRYELINGELKRMAPAGFDHGAVVMDLAGPLSQYVKAHRLGLVLGAETGYQIGRDPDTVLAPDISFVANERVAEAARPKGFFPGAPDLAVEIISPGDRHRRVQEKVQDWLAAGASLVWIVDPRQLTVTVHRRLGGSSTLRLGDVLDGETVVPGFTISIEDIFG